MELIQHTRKPRGGIISREKTQKREKGTDLWRSDMKNAGNYSDTELAFGNKEVRLGNHLIALAWIHRRRCFWVGRHAPIPVGKKSNVDLHEAFFGAKKFN